MFQKLKRVKGTLLLDGSLQSIKRAAVILKKGGLVAFPTETVYGLGALATDPAAVAKIFKAKGRPPDNPLIVHLAGLDQLSTVAVDPPDAALLLADKFWPGPLSLVLRRSDKIAPEVSAGLPTVAVRMPDHPVALQLIKAAGAPIAAPSANLAGRPSPTYYKHVVEDLSGLIDAIIMGKSCRIGVESTVLDLAGEKPVILRPGGVTREQLEAALGCRVSVAGHRFSTEKPSSPGMKYRHYSPAAPLILITGQAERRPQLIKKLAVFYRRKGLRVGSLNSAAFSRWSDNGNAEKLASRLYSILRLMDAQGIDLILAEETSVSGLGLAVMNRLKKAATRVIKV
jgi:L-threonylcarbamoyladenylate synthase